jgi:hypothetical protein
MRNSGGSLGSRFTSIGRNIGKYALGFLLVVVLWGTGFCTTLYGQGLPEPHSPQSHGDVFSFSTTTSATAFALAVQTVNCAPIDSTHIKCEQTVKAMTSGGGKWFGPYYTFSSGAPPEGYHLQSASFDLIGPHPCNGNDFSPIINDPGKPWNGHHTGAGAWAVCYLAARDIDTAVWNYSIQGLEAHDTWYIWPGTKDADKGVLVQIQGGKPGHVIEPAKMELIYVKAE